MTDLGAVQDAQENEYPSIVLSDEQEKFIEDYKKGYNLYLCGEAGSGKSTVLNEIVQISEAQSKNIAICAPTGIAAVNVRGTTIHRLFKFPIGLLGTNTIEGLLDSESREETEKLLIGLKVLIIDEISMVRSDLFWAMDHYLRNIRKDGEAFGGLQIIVVGDFSQLPPVVTHREKKFLSNRYPFATKTWALCDFKPHLLTTNFRARSDESLTKCLRGIKEGSIQALKEVNKKCVRKVPDDLKEKIVTLCTTNATARSINATRLQTLEGKTYNFKVTTAGKVKQSDMCCEEEVNLKVGARVMVIANLHKLNLFNGELGTILDIDPRTKSVEVSLDSGRVETIKEHNWDVYAYKREKGDVKKEKVGTFAQIPLKLAYAITIHKSQGKTLSPIKLELGNGCFEHGQLYVALSRAKSFDSIYTDEPIYPEELIVDKSVLKFLTENNIC